MPQLRETTLGIVLPLLDLSLARSEGRHNVFLCPLCGEEDGHLYVNMDTGMWDCKACSEEGNPLTLFAKVNGLTYKEAYKKIHLGDRGTTINPLTERRLQQSLPPMIPEAPVERRDAVYREFLSVLPLYRKHALDLKRRGFSKEHVLKNLYRSLPEKDSERRQIVAGLVHHDLTGIRGFRKRGDTWECYYTPGYLIPFKNVRGQIQALQIRRDSDDPKYVYFGFRDSGIDNSTPVHVVNPDVARRTRSVWVTEGPLKADAAASGIEACFVAPPGVSSWRSLLPVLNNLGALNVIQAFDRDQETKAEVAKCVDRFEESVVGKVHLLKAAWPVELGKGIDDALLNIRMRVEVEHTPSSLVIREIRETEVVLRKTAML